MSLSFIFWITATIALISFWWQSDKIKSTALNFVIQYCKQKNLQLLDQTMVLKGVWAVRGEEGGLIIRRRYAFEFTSTGEERYQGLIEIVGPKMTRIELQPHIIPENQDQPH